MKNIFERAIIKWGKDRQYDMLQEECGELITVINHLRRGRCKPEQVLEEMADVAIMLEELKILHGQKKFRKMFKKKCKKMKEQLSE